jgi:chromosomal replication initiator protein
MELDARYRFENFVVGAANRLAVAAARAVAESPGAVYTPLFVYSDSGLGKTHLLMAIGNHVRQLHPDLAVEYLVLDDFVDELHAAVESSQVDRLRARYQELDVLLLDDVQFVTGKPETQTELLRMFNVLHGRGAQIVMSSDRPPQEIADVEERLVTRLAGGLLVDIGQPDLETRLAIVRTRSAERGVTFMPGVAEALSQLEVTSVRELQGALNRLIAHQALGDRIIESRDVPVILGIAQESAAAPAPTASPADFESFLADVVSVVTEQVESWRTRVGDAVARWSGAGFRTDALELLLEEDLPPPNWEAVVRGYSAIAERLRALEEQATALDPSYAGAELFRDVERVGDAERLVQSLLAATTPAPPPSPAFQRDQLETGASNQLALRAADAVVAEPGKRYNPLFVHGPSGVGKTHLTHAIGNEMIRSRGEAFRAAVVSAQSFMDELVDSLQNGSVSRWRARYRGVDALVVDDVQFVADKERTQEELFHVFNALYAEGKQLVFVSDRPPKELEGLEERLRSRFEGGLVVGIQPPDPALRERLFMKFLTEAGQDPAPDLVSWLARRSAESVRDIQGVVSRLLAASDLGALPISLALARRELEGRHAPPRSLMPLAAGGSDSFFIDDEKIVWEWPELSDRLIEDAR